MDMTATSRCPNCSSADMLTLETAIASELTDAYGTATLSQFMRIVAGANARRTALTVGNDFNLTWQASVDVNGQLKLVIGLTARCSRCGYNADLECELDMPAITRAIPWVNPS